MKNPFIAAKLKKLRNDRYLKIGEMAKLLKLSHTAVGKLERGETLPSIETLYEIWIKLGCDPRDIIELIGKITEPKEDEKHPFQ